MDEVYSLEKIQDIIHTYQAKENLSPDFLLILLGPTASGKTKLAVQLAKKYDAEIISADSRQVYKRLDIGTGKDLQEYQDIPYHLINIIEPTESYNVHAFKKDFFVAYDQLVSVSKPAILCGGTGSYIQSILQASPYSAIPKNETFHLQHKLVSKQDLIKQLHTFKIPADFQIDWHNHKRLVRALEIVNYLQNNPLPQQPVRLVKNFLILGLNPDIETRRNKIDDRLNQRLADGLIQEVEGLLKEGLSHEQLQWFGLEYKYASLYLLGELTFPEFTTKLKTEIHRFAKRQMTYFRKMEKDGLPIHWLSGS